MDVVWLFVGFFWVLRSQSLEFLARNSFNASSGSVAAGDGPWFDPEAKTETRVRTGKWDFSPYFFSKLLLITVVVASLHGDLRKMWLKLISLFKSKGKLAWNLRIFPYLDFALLHSYLFVLSWPQLHGLQVAQFLLYYFIEMIMFFWWRSCWFTHLQFHCFMNLYLFFVYKRLLYQSIHIEF